MRIQLQIATAAPAAPAAASVARRTATDAAASQRIDPLAGLVAALARPDLFRIVETADGLSVEPVEGDAQPLM